MDQSLEYRLQAEGLLTFSEDGTPKPKLGNLYQRLCASLFANATTSARLRQVVFEDDECLPLVAVWIAYPGFVRNRVTAIGLHLVMRRQAGIVPLLLHC